MSNEIKAPEPLVSKGISIFLAGSIEMGTAEKWQDMIAREITEDDVSIFNPRRDDWDSSWVQEFENKQFNEQVTWELKAMEQADIIAMYFDINTKSPITLLEFGLFCRSGKLIVCCPEGFWRKCNVDIVSHRYHVQQVNTKQELVAAIKKRVEECKMHS